MSSLTQWTWVWVDSRSCWWTGRPGMLWFMGSQRAGHDWATELKRRVRVLFSPWNVVRPLYSLLGNVQISVMRWTSSSVYSLSLPFLLDNLQFSCSVVSDSLRPYDLQHVRPPCQSPTSGIYSNSCSLSCWCHPTISSSVVPFSSCPQSFPASGCFPMSQLFTSGGQSIGVSASTSVLPMNTQDRAPLGWTGWISLQSKGLSRVFSNTTVQKASILWHSAFLIVQLLHSYITTGKTIALTRLTFVSNVCFLICCLGLS